MKDLKLLYLKLLRVWAMHLWRGDYA